MANPQTDALLFFGAPGQTAEMIGTRQPRADEADAYEPVLRDAISGDTTLFARGDYVDEVWPDLSSTYWKRHLPFTNMSRAPICR